MALAAPTTLSAGTSFRDTPSYEKLTSLHLDAAEHHDRPSPPPTSHRQQRRQPSSLSLVPSMASKQSSTSIYQSALSSQRVAPRLRSQYPRDSGISHVEFVLVASFDIDRGAVMECQYPGPISGDEHMLAELMLPDQAHNRSQDWTVFFLHKDSSSGGEQEEERQEGDDGVEAMDGEEEDEEEVGMEGAPLIYVLNLVNTKHDASVKRGAVVKAMAICTRHSFLHIYKPLLLLALEEYFRAPVSATLAVLYDAVNAMDLSLLPRLSMLERIILQASNAKDLFIGKFERMIEQRKEEEAHSSSGSSRADSGPGGVTRYSLPRDTHAFESRIVYNNISVPVKIPTARSPETVGDFSIIQLIQTFSAPHSSSPQPFTLHPHLTSGGAYTHPIIVLVNALLTQKRVMFLGHNRPSGEVADAVLAACALASGGVLRGFVRHAFPYTDLTKIDDLLRIPGFVAGVTNPAFANKPEWWDLLCDLPSGRMKISSKIEPAPITDGLRFFQDKRDPAITTILSIGSSSTTATPPDATGDAAFMDAVLRAIASRLGEGAIRSMWRDWTVRLTRLAAACEEAVYGTSALHIGGQEADAGAHGVAGHGCVWADAAARDRELAGNVSRLEGWRNTRSYYSLVQDLARLYTTRPIRNVDLHHQHDRLRTQRLRPEEAAAIYLALEAAVTGPPEICQLLTVTSESHGGLFYVSLGMLHPERRVRVKTVALLQRIQAHEAGKMFWDRLGRFSKLAFLRIKREVEAGTAAGGGRGLSGAGMDAAVSELVDGEAG